VQAFCTSALHCAVVPSCDNTAFLLHISQQNVYNILQWAAPLPSKLPFPMEDLHDDDNNNDNDDDGLSRRHDGSLVTDDEDEFGGVSRDQSEKHK